VPEVTSYIEYAYNGMQGIAEYEDLDADTYCDDLVRKFIYGPGIDEPICMLMYNAQGTETGRVFYHFDALGSVIALSQFNTGNGYASIVERYAYSAFGQTTVCDGSGTPRANNASLYGNSYMFTGREYESETGLYYYRARTYSPALGRFLQTDPIGYGDGMNMYAYVGNNPLGFVDPSGTISSGSLYTFMRLANATYGPKGCGYKTQHEAGIAASREAAYGTLTTGFVEYGGWIYRNAFGTYSYTLPIMGEICVPGKKEIPINLGNPVENATASYHSHPTKHDYPQQFSWKDFLNDDSDGVAGYVVTVPTGEVFYHAVRVQEDIPVGKIGYGMTENGTWFID